MSARAVMGGRSGRFRYTILVPRCIWFYGFILRFSPPPEVDGNPKGSDKKGLDEDKSSVCTCWCVEEEAADGDSLVAKRSWIAGFSRMGAVGYEAMAGPE